jgi:hypothetical protein
MIAVVIRCNIYHTVCSSIGTMEGSAFQRLAHPRPQDHVVVSESMENAPESIDQANLTRGILRLFSSRKNARKYRRLAGDSAVWVKDEFIRCIKELIHEANTQPGGQVQRLEARVVKLERQLRSSSRELDRLRDYLAAPASKSQRSRRSQ